MSCSLLFRITAAFPSCYIPGSAVGINHSNGLALNFHLCRTILYFQMVGVYASAGWCPPCRVFSPMLSKWAKEHQDDFVVVFLSFDKRYVSLVVSRLETQTWCHVMYEGLRGYLF